VAHSTATDTSWLRISSISKSRAKAVGRECYDLWGVAPENEPDHYVYDPLA
jgi:hypothetical protein